MFIDEFIHLFHLLALTTASDYWSFKSVATTGIGILLVLVIESLGKKRRDTQGKILGNHS